MTPRMFMACLVLLVGAGCQQSKPTTQPSTASERADRAIQDPYSYSPFEKKTQPGAGDRRAPEPEKDGLRKDLDHVFNP